MFKGHKITSAIVVFLMLSVSLSMCIGGGWTQESDNTGGMYSSADPIEPESTDFYKISGTIEIGTEEVGFGSLKLILRDYETRTSHTTFVDAWGKYSFSNIPYIDGEYGLYILGGSNIMFRAVDIGNAEGNALEVDTIILDKIGSAHSTTVTVDKEEIRYSLQIYPTHNIAAITGVNTIIAGSTYSGEMIIPEMIEYEIQEGVIENYAVVDVSKAEPSFTTFTSMSSICYPFGVGSLNVVMHTNVSKITEIIIPSTVTSLGANLFGLVLFGMGNNTISNVVFEEGSPFYINNTGNIRGGNVTSGLKIPKWTSPVPVSSIATSSDTAVSLVEGAGLMLKAYVNSDATNSTLFWTSGDASVATVVGGYVKAVSPGNVVIKVTPGEDTNSSMNYIEYNITVTEREMIYGERITLDREEIIFENLGETVTLNGNISPPDATERTVAWMSGDAGVATVTQRGIVTSTGYGNTVIRAAITLYDGTSYSAECRVSVVDAYVGDRYSLHGTITLLNLPQLHEDLTVVLRNSNGVPVDSTTVDEIDGYFFDDVAPGKYYISVFGTYYPGFKLITVEGDTEIGNIEMINIQRNVEALSVSEKNNFSGTVTLPWKVDHPENEGTASETEYGVYQVNIANSNITDLTIPYGVVHFVGGGLPGSNFASSLLLTKLTISSTVQTFPAQLPPNLSEVIFEEGSPFTVDTEGWVCRDSERIVQIPAFDSNKTDVEGIEFGETAGTKYVGEIFDIGVIFTPEDATNKNVIWSSSNPSVASVSISGKVAALAKGTARITAASTDGGYTATYDLTVNDILMTGISLENDSGNLNIGEKLTLIPGIEPINATDRNVRWTTDDPSVATVTQDGVVVAVGTGTVKIAVRSGTNPALYDEFTVTVKGALTGMQVNFSTDRGSVKALLNGAEFSSGGKVSSTDTLILKYEEVVNYEFMEWKVSHGGSIDYYDKYTLRLTGITEDMTITAESRYYSLSAAPAGIVEMNLPTVDDDLQMNWYFGAGVTNTSSMKWTGHSSVPLIVGDYVYVRVLDKIHKVDLSTGMSAATAPSVSSTDFYHYLGYSHGLIFDSYTMKVYDTDLNYVMDFNAKTSKIYPDGEYTYVINTVKEGNMIHHYLAKYTADMSQKLWETDIGGENAAHYGIQPVFLDGYVYWISINVSYEGNTRVNGELRMFNSIDAATGTMRNSIVLEEISGFMLDEGWLTTDGSKLYMTAYTRGLFDDSGRYNSMVAYADIEKGKFSNVRYITLPTGPDNTSAFHVFNGRAYVHEGTNFLVYDQVGDDFVLAYTMVTSRTHGGIVLDTSHFKTDGSVSIYMLPYSGSGNTDLFIYSDSPGQTEGICRVYHNLVGSSYGSQAVRAGPNGELIWYNDSGLIYSVDVKPTGGSGREYGLFIKDGNGGTWVKETGTTPPEALMSADHPEITWTDGTPSINGKDLYLYFWSERFNRWEPISSMPIEATNNMWVISDRRPVATDVWYCDDGNGITGYILREIMNADIPSGTLFTSIRPGGTVTDVSLDHDALYMVKNGRTQLSAEIIAAGDTDSRIIWSTGNTTVATVDQNGNVKAVGKGVTAITASSYADPDMNAVCYVTVAESDPEVAVKSISLSETVLHMHIDGTGKITASVLPSDAADKGVIWTSSDPSIATVDQNGSIKAVSAGTAVITATSAWNPFLTAKCNVNVTGYSNPVTGVSLNSSGQSLDVGGAYKLTATVSPSSASNKDVIWSSSNAAVAVVDTGGNVVGVSPGTAVIFATTVDGGKAATCVITVGGGIGPGGQIVLNITQSSLAMKVGDKSVLTTYLSSGDMTGKTVTWSSGNVAVATVDTGGNVTAIGLGTTAITATLKAADGSILSAAVCTVTVENKTSGSDGGTSTVITDVVNGVNGLMSETSVQASVYGNYARVSSTDVDSILEQIGDAKSAHGSGLTSVVVVGIGSAGTFSIPSPSSISDAGAGLRITSEYGTLDIPQAVLRSITAGKAGDLTVNMNLVDREELMRDHRDMVGLDDLILEVSTYVGTIPVQQLGGSVTVSIPHSVPRGSSISDMHLWHLKDDGTIDELDFTYKGGYITFTTDHFSHFTIGYPDSGEDAAGGIGPNVIMMLMAAVIIALSLALVFMIGRHFGVRSERS